MGRPRALGILLAGGGSTRFGGPKAAAPWKNQRLAEMTETAHRFVDICLSRAMPATMPTAMPSRQATRSLPTERGVALFVAMILDPPRPAQPDPSVCVYGGAIGSKGSTSVSTATTL